MANAIRNPNHQPGGVRRASTIALILSVTEPNVWPGAMTGGVPVATTAWSGSSAESESSTSVTELRVDVAHGRHVGRPRPRVQLRQHRIRALLRLQLRDAAVRIVEIAEH